MSITITLPDELETQLQQRAQAQNRSVEELALDLLTDALEANETYLTPEEVVVKIRATPPNPHSIRPARGSLAEALRQAPQDPEFDLVVWEREWAAVEAEMKALTRDNIKAEGRE